MFFYHMITFLPTVVQKALNLGKTLKAEESVKQHSLFTPFFSRKMK